MAGRFSYSRPERRGATDPWFRIGEVDIGSAALLAILCAFSILVYGLEPPDKPILTSLALIPEKVLDGLTKPIFILGVERGMEYVRRVGDVEAVIVDKQGQVF